MLFKFHSNFKRRTFINHIVNCNTLKKRYIIFRHVFSMPKIKIFNLCFQDSNTIELYSKLKNHANAKHMVTLRQCDKYFRL